MANIGADWRHVRPAAEQFKAIDRWGCQLRYIRERIAQVTGSTQPPPARPATGSLPDLG
jgi:hypothetical protein